jgi:hypothetical protein
MYKRKINGFKRNPYIGLMHDSDLPILSRLPEDTFPFNYDNPYVGYIFHSILFPFNIMPEIYNSAKPTKIKKVNKAVQTDVDRAMEIGDEMLKRHT